MTGYEILTQLTTEEQLKMLSSINSNYRSTNKQINKELKKIINVTKYDKNGKIVNRRVVNKMIKNLISPLILTMWLENADIIDETSEDIIIVTYLFYEYLSVRKLNNADVILDLSDIKVLAQKALKDRKKLIKWNTVIKSNARLMDKRVAKTIKKSLEMGETEKQATKRLRKVMRLNNGKAKSIARTESNYYRSETKLQVGRFHEKQGNKVFKTWIYTNASLEVRATHLAADNQVVEGMDAMFTVGGKETVAPQHFGEANEDINCSCNYRMDYGISLETSEDEYNEYIEQKQ